MRAGIALREDYDAAQLRSLAKATRNAGQSRRLLALAEIYDGGPRTKAACVGGVGLQTIRDWVLSAWPRRARGPPSAGPSWQAEHRPTRGSGSDARERSDPSCPSASA